MTVWIYGLDYENGEYEEMAMVENGDVVSGDDDIVQMAFDGDIPSDAQEFINQFNSPALLASTDENVDQPQPREGQSIEEGNLSLGDGDRGNTPDWDAHFLDLFDRVWSVDSDKQLVQFNNSETPEFVKERLKDAIRSGAVFSHFEDIPSSDLMQLREYLTESLESDNWNIDGIADQIMQLDDSLTREKAEVIARTETASSVNTAREIGYEERGYDDAKFYWVGGLGPRTTDACRWLINTTNPNHGGDPVSMERLKELIEEAPSHDDDMKDNLARPENFVVHPNERKTFVRYVEGS